MARMQDPFTGMLVDSTRSFSPIAPMSRIGAMPPLNSPLQAGGLEPSGAPQQGPAPMLLAGPQEPDPMAAAPQGGGGPGLLGQLGKAFAGTLPGALAAQKFSPRPQGIGNVVEAINRDQAVRAEGQRRQQEVNIAQQEADTKQQKVQQEFDLEQAKLERKLQRENVLIGTPVLDPQTGQPVTNERGEIQRTPSMADDISPNRRSQYRQLVRSTDDPGPALKIRAEDMEAQTVAQRTTDTALDSMRRADGLIETLAAHPGLSKILGGAKGRTPDWTKEAIDAENKRVNLQAMLTQEVMTSLKAASPTGATGFGQLNQEELKLMNAMIANLERLQSPASFGRNLQKVRDFLANKRQTMFTEYGSRFGQEFQASTPPETRQVQLNAQPEPSALGPVPQASGTGGMAIGDTRNIGGFNVQRLPD